MNIRLLVAVACQCALRLAGQVIYVVRVVPCCPEVRDVDIDYSTAGDSLTTKSNDSSFHGRQRGKLWRASVPEILV